MINKKIDLSEIPSGEMICEKQLLNLINNVIDSKVEIQINKYLPIIIEKLKHLDKETLIKQFVSVEFNRFLSYYKDNPNLNNNKKDELDLEKTKKTARFHMNIGKKNGVGAQHILGLINEKINKRNVFIGKIEILKNFCFFEIDHEFKSFVLKNINNIKWRGVKLKIELAKKKSNKKSKSFKKK